MVLVAAELEANGKTCHCVISSHVLAMCIGSAAADSMTELVCAVANRLGGDFDPDNPPSILVQRPSMPCLFH